MIYTYRNILIYFFIFPTSLMIRETKLCVFKGTSSVDPNGFVATSPGRSNKSRFEQYGTWTLTTISRFSKIRESVVLAIGRVERESE